MALDLRQKAASVEFIDVTKRYGSATAVDKVSFRIEPGTLVTLLGPSGCGKTTTLRMIAGLELASSGTIRIGDKDVTRLPATERDVTMVFQSYALFPHLSVLENVAYGLRMSGDAKDKAESKAKDQLAMVGLAGFEGRLPSELSGGQQQRVAVARALVLEPEVLLFDEPLSNLDAKLRRKMRTEIREIQQRLGVTVVYVTHDQDEALSVSDTIIVMDRAVIVQQGTPRELYVRPRTLFVAGFMGEANVVDGRLERIDELRARVDIAGVPVEVERRGLEDGAVKVAIRPQAINLARTGTSQAIEGTVLAAVYLGSHMEYSVQTAAGELFVIDPEVQSPFTAGEAVSVTLSPSRGVTVLATR